MKLNRQVFCCVVREVFWRGNLKRHLNQYRFIFVEFCVVAILICNIEMFVIVFLQFDCKFVQKLIVNVCHVFQKHMVLLYFFCILVMLSCLLLLIESVCSLNVVWFLSFSFTFSFDAPVCRVFVVVHKLIEFAPIHIDYVFFMEFVYNFWTIFNRIQLHWTFHLRIFQMDIFISSHLSVKNTHFDMIFLHFYKFLKPKKIRMKLTRRMIAVILEEIVLITTTQRLNNLILGRRKIFPLVVMMITCLALTKFRTKSQN